MTGLTTEARRDQEWERMAARALDLGHRLTIPVEDTEVSFVSECTSCRLIFGVDGQEAPYQFSLGLSRPCRV